MQEVLDRCKIKAAASVNPAGSLLKFKTGSTTLTAVLIFFCFFLTGSIAGLAQTDQGAINGVVLDASGAAVPNTLVTLTNVDTGLELKTTSSNSGNYTFSPVKIGNYTVSAAAAGFGTVTQTNLQLHLQQRLEVNIDLKVGSVNTQVDVNTAPPLLQTEEASVGQEVSAQTIAETPLNGRNWVYIAQLSAGVTPVPGARGGATGDFSANGQRADMNNFILDGIDNNSSVVDFLNGASFNVKPPPEALSEFKVQTSNYSAEFGHSAGAVVNVSIKSGTNAIHGALWEYVRNTIFDNKDWNFSSIPPYHQNQFGASLGLPIFKNKLFFFADLEANRISTIDVQNSFTVPTAKMRTGDFSDLLNTGYTGLTAGVQLYEPNTHTPIPGNRLDQDPNITLDPVALRILALFPCPTASGATRATNNCQVSRSLVDNTFQYDARMDWNAGAKDQAFVRFSASNEREFHTPPLGNILDGGPFNDSGPSSFISENVVLSETHTFNPTLTNEFRMGFNYGHFTLTPLNNSTDISAQLGLGGIPFGPNQGGIPIAGAVGQASGSMNIFGSQASNSFGTPSYTYTTEHQDIAQVLDNVTKVVGRHTLKFGASVQYIRFITLQPKNPVGGYNFTGVHTGGATGAVGSGVADFALGQINEAFISQVQTSDDLRWDSGVFGQDDWSPTRRLTLNLGLRWEDPTSYRDLFGRQSNFVPTSALGMNSGQANLLLPISDSTNASVGTRFPVIAGSRIFIVNTPDQYLVSNGWKNFGPRLGASYKISDRAVVRAGYGFFYSGVESQGYSPNIGANFPFQTTNDYVAGSCSGVGNCPVALSNLGNPFTLETGFTDVLSTGFLNSVTGPVTNGIDPRTKVPYTENFNFTGEYAITNNMSAKIGYVGSESHHSTANFNVNNAYALQRAGSNINAARAFPGLGSVSVLQYFAQSSYNALQVSVDHRSSHGLLFSANYTLAHTLAIGSGGIDGGGASITNSPLVSARLNLADAGIDVRHRVTVNGSYQLPFGQGRAYANHGGLENLFVGGWDTSLTFQAQTGTPITVTSSSGNGFTAAAGAGTPWATVLSDPFTPGGTPAANNPSASCPTQIRTRANWYNPCAFGNPASGTAIPVGTFVSGADALPYFGNTHSAQIHGPGFERVNMSLFKSFPVFRESRVQFRTDVFNLFNHPSNANPSNLGITAQGGAITAPVAFQKDSPDSRFIQLSAKLQF